MEDRRERSERIKRGELRYGWTTGTCASVSAKAATYALLGKDISEIKKVEVSLPIKDQKACLEIFRVEKSNGEAFALTIKDAGDDPDVTHGAQIGARVRFAKEKGVKILGGEGVGRVTKSGLGLEIGEPDITHVPRKMIKNAVVSAALEMGMKEEDLCFEIEIFVPDGRERAKKTMLERLGVIGGIGILGTLGIVVPYSTGAWKASIGQQISVVKESGVDTIVCTTGRQSEELAKKLFPELPDVAFVDVGDFIGFTVRFASQKKIQRIILAGFIGKISKIARGEEYTHAKKSSVDIEFLVELAKEYASPEILELFSKANTAREFAEITKSFGLTEIFKKVARLAKKKLEEISGNNNVEVVIFDLEDGGVLAYEK
jgi:cobalt-precorrin-5B (C1)-methyltransferase